MLDNGLQAERDQRLDQCDPGVEILGRRRRQLTAR
jgi:hypothetical protein